MKTIIILMAVMLWSFSAYGQFISVCDRTPQIRDAIMEKVAEIDSSIECQDDDLLQIILSEIKTLNLIYVGITSLKLGDFSGLSSLEILFIKRNKTSLPPGIFDGLSSLKTLVLMQNKLTSLPPGIFDGLPLKSLGLNVNDFASLPPDIFSGLSSLESLFLGGNKLTSLPPGIFSGLSSLRELVLQSNELTSLPPDIFSDLSSLETLNLKNNQITYLPPDIFSVPSLRTVNLKGSYFNEQEKYFLRSQYSNINFMFY